MYTNVVTTIASILIPILSPQVREALHSETLRRVASLSLHPSLHPCDRSAQVREALHSETLRRVAVKIVNLRQLRKTKSAEENMRREVCTERLGQGERGRERGAEREGQGE